MVEKRYGQQTKIKCPYGSIYPDHSELVEVVVVSYFKKGRTEIICPFRYKNLDMSMAICAYQTNKQRGDIPCRF